MSTPTRLMVEQVQRFINEDHLDGCPNIGGEIDLINCAPCWGRLRDSHESFRAALDATEKELARLRERHTALKKWLKHKAEDEFYHPFVREVARRALARLTDGEEG